MGPELYLGINDDAGLVAFALACYFI